METFSLKDFKDIRTVYEKHPDCCGDPYLYVDFRKLSPIEQMLWVDIRGVGLTGFVAQYPIGPYFADFAHPKKRIVIECDGKDFHQDWAKDEKRQNEIEKLGWTVYRLTGSAIMRDVKYVMERYFGNQYDSYEEIPFSELTEFNSRFRYDCGLIFCGWIKDTYY